MAIDVSGKDINDLLKQYMLYRSGEDVAKHFLMPDPDEELRRKSMVLDIMMKQNQLGFPMNDDAYESMLNQEDEGTGVKNSIYRAVLSKAKSLPLPGESILNKAILSKAKALPLPSTAYMGYNPSYISEPIKAVFKEATHVPTDWQSIFKSSRSPARSLVNRFAKLG